MKYYKIIKTKLTKYSFELLRNIEMICFIQPRLLDSYKKFLKLKLKENKEKKLFHYLENN
jgi:hypothetical protein